MGLRKFSVKGFLKKNFDFIAGIISEVGLTVVMIGIAFAICVLLVFIKSVI